MSTALSKVAPEQTSLSEDDCVVEQVLEVPTSWVERHPNQVRRTFRDADIEAFAKQIKAEGQLEPGIVIRVTRSGLVRFRLRSGERRYRACKLAGMKFRIIIRDEMGDAAAERVAQYNHNAHRRMTHSETMRMVIDMRKVDGMAVDEIMKELHKSNAWVYDYLKLEKLDVRLLQMMDPSFPRETRLTMQVAQELARLEPDDQYSIYSNVLRSADTMENVRSALKEMRIESNEEAGKDGRSSGSPRVVSSDKRPKKLRATLANSLQEIGRLITVHGNSGSDNDLFWDIAKSYSEEDLNVLSGQLSGIYEEGQELVQKIRQAKELKKES